MYVAKWLKRRDRIERVETDPVHLHPTEPEGENSVRLDPELPQVQLGTVPAKSAEAQRARCLLISAASSFTHQPG